MMRYATVQLPFVPKGSMMSRNGWLVVFMVLIDLMI